MEYQKELLTVAEEYLSKQSSAEKTTLSYKHLMQKVSNTRHHSERIKDHQILENGMALAPYFAATCLDDAIRTQKLIRGLIHATQDKLKVQASVSILYVGCGPYATLLLPVLAFFPKTQVRTTFMEVNSDSVQEVKEVLEVLNMTRRVEAVIEADATSYVLKEDFDIVISETMQRALEHEPQVSIFQNMYKQLPATTQFIPERITLRPALVGNSHPKKTLSVFFELTDNQKIDSEYSLSVTKEMVERYEFLIVDTGIHVYGDTCIEIGESGLTHPKIILPLEMRLIGKEVVLHWEQKGLPEIIYTLR